MMALTSILIKFVFVIQCVVANLKHPSHLNHNEIQKDNLETLAQFIKSENAQFLTTLVKDHFLRLQDYSNRISQLESLYISGRVSFFHFPNQHDYWVWLKNLQCSKPLQKGGKFGEIWTNLTIYFDFIFFQAVNPI